MTTFIREYSLYEARCTGCSRRRSFNTWGEADGYASEHADEHAASRIVGRTLAGKVFDIDAPDVPWMGNFTQASEEAAKRGLPYVLWNGSIYPRESCEVRLCDGTDVPGLTRSKVPARD